MIYEIDPTGLRTVHEWTALFERLWSGQLDGIKARAEAKARAAAAANTTHSRKEDRS